VAALGLRRDASALFAAFIGFARWRAAGAAALIALGSVFDGLGLLMLVPLLGLVVGTDARRPAGRIAGLVWQALEDRPPNARLLIVLGGFALLMLVRGEVVRLRDRVTQTLQLEFVETIRLRVVRRLAVAG